MAEVELHLLCLVLRHIMLAAVAAGLGLVADFPQEQLRLVEGLAAQVQTEPLEHLILVAVAVAVAQLLPLESQVATEALV